MMELIILAGLQASGKSTFFRMQFAATHVLVSKDLLHADKGRQQRQRIENALQAGRSVVVDNTNPTLGDRAELIQLGRSYGAEIACYFFELQMNQSLARNRLRTGKERVPDIAIFATMKRFVQPIYKEGFDTLFYITANDDGTFNLGCALKDNKE